MRSETAPALTESQADELIKQWEVAGFAFIGKGFENNEDDPTHCPYCGEHGSIFWALWEHPTLVRWPDGDPQGGEYNPHLLHGVNHCYDCNYRWLDALDADAAETPGGAR